MPNTELESMTVDELAEFKRSKKSEIDAIKETMQLATSIQLDKIDEAFIEEATKQVTEAAEKENKTPEEMALYWLQNDYLDSGRHVNALRFLFKRVVNAYAIPLYRDMMASGETDIEKYVNKIARNQPDTQLGQLANDWIRRTEARENYRK